jgi:HD-GYP domain-containing protein (c-di-GMP phosphodiesterase class II)
VGDVWDALISDRPFRKAWSDKQASDFMRQQAGSRFDAGIVNFFLNAEIKRKVTKALIK